MEGRHVRQALVAFRVPERRVEQSERRTRVEEVVHVRVPGAVEAREEREPCVVVEHDEPRLVDRHDRNVVVARPVARMILQLVERLPQGIRMARFDPEEQAELGGRPDGAPRRSPSRRCGHAVSSRRSAVDSHMIEIASIRPRIVQGG